MLALPFVWSAVEARLAFGRSRRQLALGLTDPHTTNRLFLWCVASGCFAAIGFAAAAGAVLPPDASVAGALVWLQAVLYTATATIVALAFFPPGAYLRWIAAGGVPNTVR